MRAVLDANVFVSALLSRDGAPARLLRAWREGAFELILSPALLAELERVLAYPKLRDRVTREEAGELVEWLGRSATVAADPDREPPVRSPDPADDYLLALAANQNAVLVSGDNHLLGLASDLPILSPANFFASLKERT